MTSDWNVFLGIREDILLRVMDVIEQGGSAIAFPSRTLYLGRDHAADDESVRAAEASVCAWREEGALPMPNFSADQARRIRGSVVYPPPGSPDASPIAMAHDENLIAPASSGGDAVRNPR